MIFESARASWLGLFVLAGCGGEPASTGSSSPVTISPNHLRAAPFAEESSRCGPLASPCRIQGGFRGAEDCCFNDPVEACASFECSLCLVRERALSCGPELVWEDQLEEGDRVLEVDNSYYDDVAFAVVHPMTVTITERSDAFDAYLHLVAPDGEQVATNDDYEGLNSRIVHEVTRGVWHAYANSLSDGETGPYRLTIRSGGPPIATPRGVVP